MAEHKNLTGGSLHEPKGAENAALDTVYTSNGAGSGSWVPVRLPGESTATADQVYVSSGGGGGSWQSIQDIPLARISLANATIPVAVTAGDIHTPASYVPISNNLSEDFAVGGVTVDPTTKEFIIGQDGIYRITSWVAISAAAPSALVGFDVIIDGVPGGTQSPVVSLKIKDAGDITTVSGFGVGSFTAGQKVGLGLASDTSTTISLYEGVFDIERIRS